MSRRAGPIVALVSAALLLGLVVTGPWTARADDLPIRYHGQVLWIAGAHVMLRDDDGWTYPVDVRRVSQDALRGLRSGDWITVVGILSPSRSHVIASSLRVDR
ncbi:MAG TPA: hypothetical protein VMT79_11860 [Candidatus Binatia bacterium]|nr:hypothetical protein [Candidatus Binatia bacterium]